jgi:hypothetical protein
MTGTSSSVKRVPVGVVPAGAYERNHRLLRALESLFPLTFSTESLDNVEACLSFAGGRESVVSIVRRGIPCFAVDSSEAGTAAHDGGPWVQFGNSTALAPFLRGRRLWDTERCGFAPLSCEPGDKVLATKDGQPLWVRHTFEHGPGSVDVVAIAPPLMTAELYLAELLCRDRFIGLLPLVHFLKRVTGNHRWEPAPLRACLVFDDPTFPTRSYGCIDFAALAAHAREWRYHATIATIPLSWRRVSAGNAALFRESAAHLSLIIHGNDHVAEELSREYSGSERVAILAQAWQRMVAMEQRHGLSVGRIMEAPYGVIDQAMFDPLARMGYEATLITPTQFLRHNRATRFSPAIGLGAAETLPGGLCLLPRIKLTRHWETDVSIAALLDQPMIVVGHHYDAAGGMELMRNIAGAISDSGPVQWMSVADIARSQYETLRDGEALRVRLGSRRVVLPVPDGVRTLVIERPWSSGTEPESIAVGHAGAVDIASPVSHPIDPGQVPARRRRLWPLARRTLMEARDRAYPSLHRAASPAHAEDASLDVPRP